MNNYLCMSFSLVCWKVFLCTFFLFLNIHWNLLIMRAELSSSKWVVFEDLSTGFLSFLFDPISFSWLILSSLVVIFRISLSIDRESVSLDLVIDFNLLSHDSSNAHSSLRTTFYVGMRSLIEYISIDIIVNLVSRLNPIVSGTHATHQ